MLRDGERLTEIEEARALIQARRAGLHEAMRFCYEAIRVLDREIMALHDAWSEEWERLQAIRDNEASEAEGCTHNPPASAGELPGIE